MIMLVILWQGIPFGMPIFVIRRKSMKVVSSKAIYEEGGDKYVKCKIFSDTVPSPLPEPEDIPGYDETFAFYPGSSMYIVTTGDLYMAGEDGDWHTQ